MYRVQKADEGYEVLNDYGNVVARFYGDGLEDLEINCEHEFVFGDDDECGVCEICGALCRWHWERDVVDEGYDNDGEYFAKDGEERVIDEVFDDFRDSGENCEILDFLS